VMAVPGHPLVSTTAGANALLADGARPALCVEDVLEELATLPPLPGVPQDAAGSRETVRAPVARNESAGEPAAQPAGGMPRRLLAALSETPEPAEALARSVSAPLEDVLAAITELEILGLARAHPGSRFTRSSVR
jgi:DNA processing protein